MVKASVPAAWERKIVVGVIRIPEKIGTYVPSWAASQIQDFFGLSGPAL
jgi:hypothetical protein